jgi:hypothetical protein
VKKEKEKNDSKEKQQWFSLTEQLDIPGPTEQSAQVIQSTQNPLQEVLASLYMGPDNEKDAQG